MEYKSNFILQQRRKNKKQFFPLLFCDTILRFVMHTIYIFDINISNINKILIRFSLLMQSGFPKLIFFLYFYFTEKHKKKKFIILIAYERVFFLKASVINWNAEWNQFLSRISNMMKEIFITVNIKKKQQGIDKLDRSNYQDVC